MSNVATFYTTHHILRCSPKLRSLVQQVNPETNVFALYTFGEAGILLLPPRDKKFALLVVRLSPDWVIRSIEDVPATDIDDSTRPVTIKAGFGKLRISKGALNSIRNNLITIKDDD